METARKIDTTASERPDLEAVKRKQQVAWGTGDYGVIGGMLQIVAESLCEAVDLRAGERVLDVACGTGNAAIAAARRNTRVTGTDYVPALLERARERAAAEHLDADFRQGDAEDLPFHDGAFDVVLSTFGVMFAPDQGRAVEELLRVCRPGGRIGLANWTPEGFIGQMFKVVGRHAPPPAGVRPPAQWGTEARLRELFGGDVTRLSVERREFVWRFSSPEHFIDVFRRWYGPMNVAFGRLDEAGQAAFARDLRDLIARFDRGGGDGLVAPGEYVEVVAIKR